MQPGPRLTEGDGATMGPGTADESPTSMHADANIGAPTSFAA